MAAAASVVKSPYPAARDLEALRGVDGRIYPGWRTTGAAAVGLALGPTPILVFAFSTFTPALEREFGWGVGAISLGATLVMLMTVVGSLLAGALSDRFGSRRLVLWSLPLFAAAVAALSLLGPDIRWFYGGLVLIGLAAVGVWPVTYNKLTQQWFDRHLGMSLGLANAGLALGAAALPVIAGFMIDRAGWRMAFIGLGLLAFILPWPLALAALREKAIPALQGAGHNAASPAVADPAAGMNFTQARGTREFWLALVGFMMLGAASSSVVVHQMRILTDTGMTPQRALALQSVIGIAMLVGRVCTGWLLDRVRAHLIMVVLCFAGTVALLLLAAGAPMGSALLCAVLIGVLIGAEFDVLSFLIPRYFGRRAFGALYGVIFGAFQIAAAATIAVLGMARAATGSYSAGLVVVALLLVVGGLCFSAFGAYRFAAPSRATGR